jgi:hypothetical protein
MNLRITVLWIVLLSLGWYGCDDVWNGNQPPVITSVTSTTAILDLPFSYIASAEDPEDDTIEFIYSGLPDWLVVDGNTVRGTPESTGTYQFTVTAEDGEGESDRITVTIQVKSNASLLEEVVAAVSIDSLLETVNALSGNTLLLIFDPPRTIKTRVSPLRGNGYAAEYLEWKLNSYGLLAGRFDYSETGNNVIAFQQGSAFPDSVYIIGAHYDCMISGTPQNPQSTHYAPGADDNASGVAAVLEAARILSQITTRYSILYALWDEQEHGLLGSMAYAKHVVECEIRIAGVIDLDMIAYDSNDDGVMLINGSYQGRSAQMVDRTLDVIELFNLDLNPHITMEGRGSDSVPFYWLGYSTLSIIEDELVDFNAFYRSYDDTVDKFNTSYFHQMSTLAIATLAILVGAESPGVLLPTTFWFCV